MIDLRGRVVVLMGASSGLGRALAIELARRGANLVVAARREQALVDVANDCERLGVRAAAVAADVTYEVDVHHVASIALERFGRIDVWINNAGVTYFARLEDGPFDPHRRVIETNLFGAIFGARAAVPIFRRQHHGVLIDVGSILSEVGQAYVPSYTISKFGVRGLSETLRVELADEPDIHVCTALPYAIETPHFEDAANELGVAPRPLPPSLEPEAVARAIADLAERPQRTLRIPRIMALGIALHRLFPRTVERLLLDALRRWHFSRERQLGNGNLYVPATPVAKIRGDRKPEIGTLRFVAWLAVDLVRIQVEGLRRRVWRPA
jgi:NAD(P)-dependent dehydrogenase (short-subunit alcohol dehydrogenase family)